MKLTVLQEDFQAALGFVSGFVNPRAQLPVLGNILLSAGKTKLTLSATNLETSVVFPIGAKVEKEGKLTVPARVLADLIVNLDPGSVELESDKEKLKIKSTGFSSVVAGMNAADFPEIVAEIGDGGVSLPKVKFSEALSKVMFSVSSDETRPMLTGVLFVFDKGKLTLVSTDGFRLSQKKLVHKDIAKTSPLIVPRGVLGVVGKAEDDIVMEAKDTDRQVVFGLGKAVVSSRVLEGEFPDYEKRIPKNADIKVAVDPEDLLKAVKLAAVFARDSANLVKLTLAKASVKVSAESSSYGSQEKEVDAKVSGVDKKFEIAFNYRFLEDLLKVIKGNEVQIELTDPNAPAVFRDPKDPDFLHLIMPVRITS